MRGTRVWARLLGVQGTIIEDVSVEEGEEGEIAALVGRSASAGAIRDAVGSAGGDTPGRTVARGVGSGGASTLGRCGASSRRRRPGSAAPSTG